MADTQALAALLERVESGTGEDRELDAASHVAMCKPKQYPDDHRRFRLPHPSLDHMDMCAAGTYWLVERSGRSLQTSPRYTYSLDAVMALVPLNENVIGCTLTVRDGSCDAHVWAPEGYGPDIIVEREDEEIARALLAALIKAKMEEQEWLTRK